MTDDLRQRYEALLMEHQRLDVHGCVCGWNTRPLTGASFAAHVTDAILAVRDERLERLAQIAHDTGALMHDWVDRAEAAERKLDAIRELHRSVDDEVCFEDGFTWPCPTRRILDDTGVDA